MIVETCNVCDQELTANHPHLCPEKDYEPPDEMLVAKDEKYN